MNLVDGEHSRSGIVDRGGETLGCDIDHDSECECRVLFERPFKTNGDSLTEHAGLWRQLRAEHSEEGTTGLDIVADLWHQLYNAVGLSCQGHEAWHIECQHDTVVRIVHSQDRRFIRQQCRQCYFHWRYPQWL